MKSILQEASSIEKAVAKAWEAAGHPTEFSIKILERGQRGFLGFNAKNAIISIVYESISKPTEFPRKKPIQKHTAKHKTARTDESLSPKPEQKKQATSSGWNDKMAKEITEILEKIIKFIDSKAKVKTNINGNSLFAIFSEKVLPDEETERSMRASLSYLLLQILKRKLRRKLRGFRLHIDSATKGL